LKNGKEKQPNNSKNIYFQSFLLLFMVRTYASERSELRRGDKTNWAEGRRSRQRDTCRIFEVKS
jgi:hypothetical protein